jgi:hypothetical protein
VEVAQQLQQAQPHLLQRKAVADAHARPRAKRQVGRRVACRQVLTTLQAAEGARQWQGRTKMSMKMTARDGTYKITCCKHNAMQPACSPK